MQLSPQQQFLFNFLPSEVRAGQRIMTMEEVNYALSWITTNKDDGNESLLCFRQLGLVDSSGGFDRERLNLVSDYIWEQHPRDPDFAKLLTWLQKNHPRAL